MAVFGTVVVEISATARGLRRELEQASRRLQTFARRVGPTLRRAFTAGTVAITAATAGLGLLVRQSLATNDALAKTADRLGLTTEALAGLRQAAELSGVASRQLELGLQRMTRRVSEAARGTGEAQDALKELGLEAAALNRMTPEQQFRTVAAVMANVTNQADRVRLAFKLFDSEGVALLNTLELGAAGLERAAADARRFGTALTRVDAAKIEQANDALTRMRLAFRGVVTQLTVRLAPGLAALAERIAEAAREANGFRVELDRTFRLGAKGAAILSNVVAGVRFAFKGAQVAVSFFAQKYAEALAFAARAMAPFVDAQIKGINLVIAALNKLPGVAIEALAPFSDSNLLRRLDDAAIVLRARTEELREELDAIALAGLPGERVGAFFDELTAAAERAARETAKARERVTGTGTGGFGDTEEEKSADEKARERFERIREQLLTEREIQGEHFARQREALVEALAANQVTEAEFREFSRRAEDQHMKRLIEIRKKGWTDIQRFQAMSLKKQTATVLGELEQLSAGVAQSNRSLFNLNKAAAIANAIVNTYQGMTKSLAAYPWPLAGIMAAAHLAAGLAQVNAIRSTSFGGRGTTGGAVAPSVAGTTAAQPVADVDRQGREPIRNATVTIVGQGGFTGGQVADLARELGEFLGDGGRLGNVAVARSL